MTIKIVHRYDSTRVLYEGEHETVRDAVEAAVKAQANLAGANLYGANLYGTNLAGANLAGASLGGACLAEANLDRAKINSGTVSALLATGTLKDYSWQAWRMEDGSTVLRVGCEERPLSEWEEHLPGICRQHEPSRADKYESAYRPLLAFVRALSEGKETP